MRCGFLLEHRDELVADDLALALGVGHAVRACEETLAARSPRAGSGGASRPARATPASASSRRSSPWSTSTHVSRSPIARWMSVAATVESTPPESPHSTWPSPTCARISRTASLEEVPHRPAALRARDPEQEVRQHLLAVRRVHDLGMELDQVVRQRLVARGGERAVASCARRFFQPGPSAFDLVAVAHPGAEALRHAARTAASGRPATNVARPYSACVRLRQLAAHQLLRDLEAVADAQHRLLAAS